MKKISLMEALEGIEDTRRDRSVLYPLHEVCHAFIAAVTKIRTRAAIQNNAQQRLSVFGQPLIIVNQPFIAALHITLSMQAFSATTTIFFGKNYCFFLCIGV